ncbi:hypothetical protein EIP91_004376 [Steccherinum ochraceum]|uniref:DNA2/NAM7 helicase-like C-terminal domain-containing protein n=1 Tax=Steccherinum ochraceum TaxID=92696 RepID=A0A4R0RQZ0_9APHY|nr:hypothetical protein EIP91_004376 [Steccherinum ochraceum]
MVKQPPLPSLARPGLFKAGDPAIQVHRCSSPNTDLQTLDASAALAAKCGAVGIAPAFSSKGVLKDLAIACQDQVLMITMDNYNGSLKKTKNKNKAREALRERILKNSDLVKVCFDVDRISLSLYFDHHHHISSAVDFQYLRDYRENLHHRSDQAVLDNFEGLSGDKGLLHRDNILHVVRSGRNDTLEQERLSLKAYLAWKISTLPEFSRQLPEYKTICTVGMPIADLLVLSKCLRDYDCLRSLQPSKVKNDVGPKFTVGKDGNINVDLDRYTSRVRRSQVAPQRILIQTTSHKQPVIGRAVAVKGKTATVKVNGRIRGEIRSVHTVGKDYTNAELERVGIILAALHGTSSILKQPLARSIFSTGPSLVSSDSRASTQRPSPSIHSSRPLNTSQTQAVRRILSSSPKDRICLVQGPPGTGKTTVIAATVTSLISNPDYSEKRSIWIFAQSNVAVKNVAEKLADVGFFDFKVLVSQEFHFQWHEHLYRKIEDNVIKSSVFTKKGLEMHRLILDCRVILCTLSMLCHPELIKTKITKLVPLEIVMVDEASQIEMGDLLPLLHKFGDGIQKLAFIGDNKQLAPYGSEDIKDLCSIFEVKHLSQKAVFLNTQYRMPEPIGDFISRKVYGGRLSTQHDIKNRNCLKFIDVGGQEASEGTSFQNTKEVDAVIHVVRKFVKEEKSFRVITPYDAQRALLEKSLRSQGLPWQDKCFCVDSFQGNEDDHIIISVVRTAKTGFLRNIRRSNVMLSRCRKSMTICTKRSYLSSSQTKDTLLGELAAEFGPSAWMSWGDLLNERWQ